MGVTDEAMRANYAQLHRDAATFQGYQTPRYADIIGDLVRITESKDLLDYGCGKGMQYEFKRIHEGWGVPMPYMYDPYYGPHSKKPECSFDGVICTDVMEHVPTRDVRDVLRDIGDYAEKFIFLSISTKKAKKFLPDGQNAHVTVKPSEWWDRILDDMFQDRPDLHVVAVYEGE